MVHQLILSHMTHLPHFAAGLRLSVVSLIHIHTLCRSSEEITTQATIIPSLIHQGFFLLYTISEYSFVPYHFSIYSVPYTSPLSISLFHFLTSHLAPTQLSLVTMHSHSFWLLPAILMSHTTCNPLLCHYHAFLPLFVSTFIPRIYLSHCSFIIHSLQCNFVPECCFY